MSAPFKKYAFSKFPFCSWCGILLDYGNASVDHILPRSKGGTAGEVGQEWSNYCLACKKCNNLKGARSWGVPRYGLRLIRPADHPGVKPEEIFVEYHRYKEERILFCEKQNHCWFCGGGHRNEVCPERDHEIPPPTPVLDASYYSEYHKGYEYGTEVFRAGLDVDTVRQAVSGLPLGFVRGFEDRLGLNPLAVKR